MSSLTFARTDTSILGRWWWTIDRWQIAALLLLLVSGVLLIFAAGPPAAERIGAEKFHFVRRQLMFLPLGVVIMLVVSFLSPLWVRRLAAVGFVGALVLLFATLQIGTEIKGSVRWIQVAGISLQASEFIKPTFAVVTAWMLAEWRMNENPNGVRISLALFLLVAVLLISQPDLGQTLLLTAIWATQFFLAGMPMLLVVVVIVLGLAGLAAAYMTLDHVSSRIDRFFNPELGDSYQITKALQAFGDGGLFGRGPGEGRVKEQIPDAHTDFIFAVAGEEFGLIACLALVMLFAFVVLRGLSRVRGESSLFVLLAVGGLLAQFGFQAMINMASSLSLMPTKGMTLPFISYGGSSLLGLAIGMGMVLALTRRRPVSTTQGGGTL